MKYVIAGYLKGYRHMFFHRAKAWLREHQSFLLLLAAFSVFRFLAVFLLRHGGYLVDYAPDAVHYFEMGRLAGAGKLPLFDYWVEYPPLGPWLAALAYRLSLHVAPIGQPLFVFNLIFRFLLLPFDIATLALIYASAGRLAGRERAWQVAGLWALLFAPLFVLLGWFEPLVLFFLVLGLYGLLSDRPWLAGLACGLGFMAKVFPAILAPVALFGLRNLRQRVTYVAAAALSAIVVVLPPLIVSPGYVLATFSAFLSRSSWETVWALLEGYQGYGVVAQMSSRIDPGASSFLIHPGRLPWLPINIAFAALYLFLITRRIAWQDKARLAAFALFSLVFFLLYSKGFSPQWMPFIGTMALVTIPGWRGLGYALLLDGLMVAEWPVAFVVMKGQDWFLAVVIILRTVLLLLLALETLARVFDAPAWRLVRRLALPLSVLLCLGGALGVAVPAAQAYTATRLQAEPFAPLVRSLQAESRHDPIIVVQPGLLERLQPYLPAGTVHLFPSTGGRAWAEVPSWLSSTLGTSSGAWLLYDTDDPGNREYYEQMQTWFTANACPNLETWYGPVQAHRYAIAPVPAKQPLEAQFAGGLRLLSVTPPREPLRPGDALCLHLEWQPTVLLPADYAIFVQVLAADGSLVAQCDLWPNPGTRQWAPGVSARTAHGLLLPRDLAAGAYTVQMGLYDANGTRLPLAKGGDALRLADLVVSGSAP